MLYDVTALGESIAALLSRPVLSRQLLQEYLGLLEVGGVKALGEPAVDRRQQRGGLRALPLLRPEATEAHGGAEL